MKNILILFLGLAHLALGQVVTGRVSPAQLAEETAARIAAITAETARAMAAEALLAPATFADVRDFGAVAGTGLTELQRTANVTAIQAALDTGENVYLPDFYEINAAVTKARHGQVMFGKNTFLSGLIQTGTGSAILVRKDDSVITQGGGLIYGGSIRSMTILGPGKATSTGKGVDISGAASFNGDWATVQDCYIRGFDVGIYNQGVGQAKIERCIISYNNVGISLNADSQNSHQIYGCAIVQGTTGVLVNNGCVVIQGGDYGYNTAGDVDVAGSACVVSVKGGNFEGPGTARAFVVQAGATLTLDSVKFIRAATTVKPVNLTSATSRLTLVGMSCGVDKASTLAVVQFAGGNGAASNFSEGANVITDNGQNIAPTPFQQRYYSSFPSSAGSAERGLILQRIGLSGFAADGLFMIVQQRNGTKVVDSLNNYERLITTNVTGTTQTIVENVRYTAGNASEQVVFTLPTSSSSEVGISEIEIIGVGAGGWRISQLANQSIIFGSSTSTVGTGGYMQSAHQRDCVRLKYVATNTWQVISAVGSPGVF